jgi:DNA (cytosine-5)-methyltransferase 1
MVKMIKIASLFSGCGGSDLGIQGGFIFLEKEYKKLDTKIVWANDNDLAAVETYKANFGNHILHKSITEIPSKEIPQHDILIGGFPCQTFSIVGQRNGLNDPRGLLFEEMVRILKDKKPKAFIAENVKGLVNIKKGSVLKHIIERFFEAGYIVEYKVLHSADYGIPQKRERVFIVGTRKDLNLKFEFPKNTVKKWTPLKKVLLKENQINKKYYFSERAVEGLKKSNKAFNKGRAQNIDEPCNTISAHLAKVSLNGTDPVLLVGHEKYRRFTPLEAARIQSFPDNFKFIGSDLKAYKQIGNAIPPVLMWHVAKALIEQIETE